MKKLKLYSKFSKKSQFFPVVGTIVAVAAVGIYLLTGSHAASPYVTSETEAGTLTGTAVVQTDSTASAGKSVQFGSGTTGTSSNPTGEFYIVGSQIVDPNGNIYFPHGANLATPDTLDTSNNAVGLSANAVAWGFNTVRLVTMCTPGGASWDYPSEYGTTAFYSMLSSLIAEYTSKKIVVDLTCFDLSYGGSNYTADYPQLQTFWKYAADTYKNNPYVWFDVANEAFWSEPASVYSSWYDDWYSLIRGEGAENIIVADVENSGNDAGWNSAPQITESDMGPAIDAGKCNILFAMHNYGGLADTQDNYTDFTVYKNYWQNVENEHLAMMVEENGYTASNPAQDNVAGSNSTMTVAPSYGIGSLWWAGESNDDFSLKTDGGPFNEGGNDVNLSTGGQQVWNYNHATYNLGKFTGSYASSNCTSAK